MRSVLYCPGPVGIVTSHSGPCNPSIAVLLMAKSIGREEIKLFHFLKLSAPKEKSHMPTNSGNLSRLLKKKEVTAPTN